MLSYFSFERKSGGSSRNTYNLLFDWFDWSVKSETWRHAHIEKTSCHGRRQKTLKTVETSETFREAFCLFYVNMAATKTDKGKVALITGITGQVGNFRIVLSH